MQSFIWGLQRDIAQMISILHPAPLSQAITTEEIELEIKFLWRPPLRGQIGHASQHGCSGLGSPTRGNPKRGGGDVAEGDEVDFWLQAPVGLKFPNIRNSNN